MLILVGLWVLLVITWIVSVKVRTFCGSKDGDCCGGGDDDDNE